MCHWLLAPCRYSTTVRWNYPCRGSSGSHAYERLRTVLQQEARCYCFCLFVWRCFRATIIIRKRISYQLSKDVRTSAGYSVVEDDRYSHEELRRSASSASQQNLRNARCAQILLASIENCSGTAFGKALTFLVSAGALSARRGIGPSRYWPDTEPFRCKSVLTNLGS